MIIHVVWRPNSKDDGISDAITKSSWVLHICQSTFRLSHWHFHSKDCPRSILHALRSVSYEQHAAKMGCVCQLYKGMVIEFYFLRRHGLYGQADYIWHVFYPIKYYYSHCHTQTPHPSKLAFTKRHCVFTCARNIVLQYKINFCVDFEHMVCFPCVSLYFICVSLKMARMNIGFVCVYFEFTSF